MTDRPGEAGAVALVSFEAITIGSDVKVDPRWVVVGTGDEIDLSGYVDLNEQAAEGESPGA